MLNTTLKNIILLLLLSGCNSYFDVELGKISQKEEELVSGEGKEKYLEIGFKTNTCIEKIRKLWRVQCFYNNSSEKLNKKDVLKIKDDMWLDFFRDYPELNYPDEDEICIKPPYTYNAIISKKDFHEAELHFLKDDNFDLLTCYLRGVSMPPAPSHYSSFISIKKEILNDFLKDYDK